MNDDIRDELLELRRYVRTDVEHVREGINAIIRRLGTVYRGYAEHNDARAIRYSRWVMMLSIGLEYIQVHPQCLEGYLDGIAFEMTLRDQI